MKKEGGEEKAGGVEDEERGVGVDTFKQMILIQLYREIHSNLPKLFTTKFNIKI